MFSSIPTGVFEKSLQRIGKPFISGKRWPLGKIGFTEIKGIERFTVIVHFPKPEIIESIKEYGNIRFVIFNQQLVNNISSW
jgi:hypothetical protein